MKVLNSAHLSPFGGLNFVLEEFDKQKIGSTLEKHLPALPAQSQYNWRDLMYSFWSVFFCGGDCIEDPGPNLRTSLAQHPFVKTPSPDTILKRMKELAQSSLFFETPTGHKKHEFSFHTALNTLNLKLIKSKILSQSTPVILDYDNTLIYCQKADAKMTYLKRFGYAPGVGMIDDKVVYVENRNGNSDPQTLQQDTLTRMFEIMEAEGIRADIFRADGGSYQLSTLLVISQHVEKVFIRARMSTSLHKAIQQIRTWQPVEIDGQTCYRGSTLFTPFEVTAKRNKQQHLVKPYKLVVTKEERMDGQLNLFTGEAMNYHAIVTNDLEMTDDQVVWFYNQRGAIEKQFDILKNDFGWQQLPFSKLAQNTVFLIFTAICKNLYAMIIKKFAQKYRGLSAHFRIKKFIFRFITIPAKWLFKSRQWQLRLYGSVSHKT